MAQPTDRGIWKTLALTLTLTLTEEETSKRNSSMMGPVDGPKDKTRGRGRYKNYAEAISWETGTGAKERTSLHSLSIFGTHWQRNRKEGDRSTRQDQSAMLWRKIKVGNTEEQGAMTTMVDHVTSTYSMVDNGRSREADKGQGVLDHSHRLPTRRCIMHFLPVRF